MAVYRSVEVDAVVSKSVFLADASISDNVASVSAEVASTIHMGDYPDYEGDYDFTPCSEAQTINMENMVVHLPYADTYRIDSPLRL